MNHLNHTKRSLGILLCLLMLMPTTLAAPTIPSPQPPTPTSTPIDMQYIHNITVALSNIVYTEYNESRGEIAKGRMYGSIGEHKAAQIIYQNMTALGLNTTLQRVQCRPDLPDDILTQLDVLNYTLTLNGRPLDCFIAGSWKGPRDQPDQINTTLTYHGLTVKPLPKNPYIYNRSLAKETQDFVFIGPDQWNDPNASLPLYDLAKPYLSPLKSYIIFHVSNLFNIARETASWYRWYPHCQGLLLYDFIPDCHDNIYLPPDYNSVPVAFITGSDGHQILNNPEESMINLSITQHLNTSIETNNVIGELPGADISKTVLVTCLYDGWWNQATADSAIGIGIMLGIAKYYIDNHITPRYNLKFVALCGEETGLWGAQYFDVTCTDSLYADIDLNQLGFTQNTPRISLDIISNHPLFLLHAWKIIQRSDYINRTGNTTDIKPIFYATGSLPSDAAQFAMNHPDCKTILFLKDGGWILHHRDGQNHTAGDSLAYFNWTDTLVTTEMITNVTLDLTNPHEIYGFTRLMALKNPLLASIWNV